jgi:hypothetical protein
MAKISYPIHPPSIADLRRMGLSGIHVTLTNSNCKHCGVVAWDQLSLADYIAFPEIKFRRRFRCQSCGSRSVHLMPDWSAYQASGMGPAAA